MLSHLNEVQMSAGCAGKNVSTVHYCVHSMAIMKLGGLSVQNRVWQCMHLGCTVSSVGRRVCYDANCNRCACEILFVYYVSVTNKLDSENDYSKLFL